MNCRPGELAFIVNVTRDNDIAQPLIDQLIGAIVRVTVLRNDDVWSIEPHKFGGTFRGEFQGRVLLWSATAILDAISDDFLRPIRGEPEAHETPAEIINELAPRRQLEHTR